ncbi:hypothetical protein [Citromicrobium bathyomarinum]|uniref:hypothetical protein n=1 Tax=Citromicrobium bathyomarinum TaxID=72174 RepID=UPI00315A5ADE
MTLIRSNVTNFIRITILFFAAVVCLGLQLDFATQARPALSPWIPEIFRAHAYQPLTLKDLRNKNTEKARVHARFLIERRPIPAESLTLLAVASLDAEPAIASRALLASATRGWREPLVQSAVINAALADKDWRVLSERLDALQRTGKIDAIPTNVWNTLLSHDEGRRALADRLAQDPVWMSRFLNMAGRQISANIFAATISEIHSQRGTIDCHELSRTATRLIRQGHSRQASTIWGGDCAASISSMPYRFQHGGDGKVAGPFDWSYPPSPGIRRDFTARNNSWAISYRHSDRLRGVLAERFIDLQAGNYVMMIDADARSSSTISPEIKCFGNRYNVRPVSLSQVGSAWQLKIPQTCPVQMLRLKVTQGEGRVNDVEIRPND